MAINSSDGAAEWIVATKDFKPVSEKQLAVIFDTLPPVSPEILIGEWHGHGCNTGHPGNEKNKELKWVGKTFRSTEDVEPMVLDGGDGKRVWFEAVGKARLREVKYNGVVSTAMIYDDKPIIDHFRYVDENTIAGVMDTNLMPGFGLFYFYLTKL